MRQCKTPVDILPWICWSERKRRSRQTCGQCHQHEWLAPQKIRSVEELETPPAGTKPSRQWPPRGGRRWKRNCLPILLEWTKERAQQSSLNGQKKGLSSIRRTFGTVSKALWRKLLRDGVEHIYRLCQAHQYHQELNWTKRSSARTPLALYNYVRKHFCPYRNRGIHRWGFPQRRGAGPHWSWLPANIADCCQALVWSGSVQSANCVCVCVLCVVCCVCVCVCACACVFALPYFM